MLGIDQSMQQARELISVWRRRIIVGVVVLVLALAAVSQIFTAIRIALEIELGAVQGRLFLAAVLVLVGFMLVATLWNAGKAPAASDPEKQRVSSIVDAIGLGFAFAQDLKAAAGFGTARRKPASAQAKREKKARVLARRAQTARAADNPPL